MTTPAYPTLRHPTTPAIPAHDAPCLPYPTLPYDTLRRPPYPPAIPTHDDPCLLPLSYHPCTPSILLDLLDLLDLLLLFALDLAVS